MSKIKVDIEDLISKLQDMVDDDYVTAELEIQAGKFSNELSVSAISFDYDEPIPYGTLGEAEEEL